MSIIEISGCACDKDSDIVDKYKQLETLYENFKKSHIDECSQLQIEISYFKDLLTKGLSRKHVPQANSQYAKDCY